MRTFKKGILKDERREKRGRPVGLLVEHDVPDVLVHRDLLAVHVEQRVGAGGQVGQMRLRDDRGQLEFTGETLHDIVPLEDRGVPRVAGVLVRLLRHHHTVELLGDDVHSRLQVRVDPDGLQVVDVDRAEVGDDVFHVILLKRT